MVQINLTEVLKDAPRGEWLALSHTEDRVVASAVLIEDAVAAAKAKGEDNPVMMKVPPTGFLVL
jgi:hypothetical protein